MNWQHFEPFTFLHFVALLGCAIPSLLVVVLSARFRRSEKALRLGRRFIAGGNLLIWVIACGFWFHPDFFRIEQSLPLQFCNIANLIAVIAVGWRVRAAQSLLYFWTFALCIWAFLTPFLMVGPAHPWFWVFWLYHLCIPLATSWVLFVERLRLEPSDFRTAWILTFIYTGALAALNFRTGWNYGFVGQGKPGQPSMIDVLGPYPARLLWMLLIASALFFLLYLPAKRSRSADLST